MAYMTVDEIQSRVTAIAEAAGDYEQAHGLEDKLYHDFVSMIATDGFADNQAILALKARLVLSTKQLSFNRYTA